MYLLYYNNSSWLERQKTLRNLSSTALRLPTMYLPPLGDLMTVDDKGSDHVTVNCLFPFRLYKPENQKKNQNWRSFSRIILMSNKIDFFCTWFEPLSWSWKHEERMRCPQGKFFIRNFSFWWIEHPKLDKAVSQNFE